MALAAKVLATAALDALNSLAHRRDHLRTGRTRIEMDADISKHRFEHGAG